MVGHGIYYTHLYLPPRSTGRQSCSDQRIERRDFNLLIQLIQTGSKPPHISDGFRWFQVAPRRQFDTSSSRPETAASRSARRRSYEGTGQCWAPGLFQGEKDVKIHQIWGVTVCIQYVYVCIPWSQFSIKHNWYLAIQQDLNLGLETAI